MPPSTFFPTAKRTLSSPFISPRRREPAATPLEAAPRPAHALNTSTRRLYVTKQNHRNESSSHTTKVSEETTYTSHRRQVPSPGGGGLTHIAAIQEPTPPTVTAKRQNHLAAAKAVHGMLFGLPAAMKDTQGEQPMKKSSHHRGKTLDSFVSPCSVEVMPRAVEEVKRLGKARSQSPAERLPREPPWNSPATTPTGRDRRRHMTGPSPSLLTPRDDGSLDQSSVRRFSPSRRAIIPQPISLMSGSGVTLSEPSPRDPPRRGEGIRSRYSIEPYEATKQSPRAFTPTVRNAGIHGQPSSVFANSTATKAGPMRKVTVAAGGGPGGMIPAAGLLSGTAVAGSGKSTTLTTHYRAPIPLPGPERSTYAVHHRTRGGARSCTPERRPVSGPGSIFSWS